MNNLKLAFFLSSMIFAGSAFAGNHPNIEAAISDVQNALTKMHAAQSANEYDMSGHAKKAEELLNNAVKQMQKAASAASSNKGKKQQ